MSFIFHMNEAQRLARDRPRTSRTWSPFSAAMFLLSLALFIDAILTHSALTEWVIYRTWPVVQLGKAAPVGPGR